MTERIQRSACCAFGGYKGVHSPWCQVIKAPPEDLDAFERWWKDEGVKNIGLESARSFARRCWTAAKEK